MKKVLIASLVFSGVLMAQMGSNVPAFSDFDANADAKVSQEEFENAQQKRMTQRAEEGRLMKNAANAPTFADIDTNKDGSFDAAEFGAHQAKERAMKQGMGKGMGQGSVK